MYETVRRKDVFIDGGALYEYYKLVTREKYILLVAFIPKTLLQYEEERFLHYF